MDSLAAAETEDDHRRDLASFGFPESVVRRFALQGTVKLYKWQADCLTPNVVDLARSLVYAAPTSGGKTLVAELLMLKRILQRSRGAQTKALFVLPFISLVEEKERDLRKIFGPLAKRVKGFYSWRAPDLEFDGECTQVCIGPRLIPYTD